MIKMSETGKDSKVLDLGCGRLKTEGAIGLDKYKLEGVDVVWDLEKLPLPFKDNEFDLIIARHVFEHIDNFWSLMDDIYRILKPNGVLKIWVPYFSSSWAFAPDHKRFFTIAGLTCYFRGEERENYYTKARFKVKKVELDFGFKMFNWTIGKVVNWIIRKKYLVYEMFFAYLFPFAILYVELESKK